MIQPEASSVMLISPVRTSWYARLDEALYRRRLPVLAVVHAVLFAASFLVAYLIRFEGAIPRVEFVPMCWLIVPVILAKLLIFYSSQTFHSQWRYVTFADILLIAKASTIALVLMFVSVWLFQQWIIPRSIMLLDWMATIMLVGGTRAYWRVKKEWVWSSGSDRLRTLIVGANKDGESLARTLKQDRRLKHDVVGFLDIHRDQVGRMLGGVKIWGTHEEAWELSIKLKVQQILVVAGRLTGKDLRRLMDDCEKAGVAVKMMPTVEEFLAHPSTRVVRDININDLIRRDPAELDFERIQAMVEGRRVMITGAGGSIGSEICRQIIRCKPAEMILVERAENNLYHIERELRPLCGATVLTPAIADIGNEPLLRRLFMMHRPQLVFHAAAHKHVPLMEDNPGEAISNNVFGTQTLADLAHEMGVDRFVLISTDKAVNPTSVMGVSKQLCERYVLAYSDRSQTRFVVVRFGNVLASAGSVVPLFLEQINNGGPVTITHKDMVRFFMTIPEASQLVMQAAAMGKGGEIFVLDMGEPIKIVDLAHDLIRLSGAAAKGVEVIETGVRPGEKLFEELCHAEDELTETAHPRVRSAYHQPWAFEEVLDSFAELRPIVHSPTNEIRTALKRLVPEYKPVEPADNVPAIEANREAS